jgi:hypothetical protein
MAEKELKTIVDPLIDENTTYGLVESDDEYESEEIEEIIETEQAEAYERAARLEEIREAERAFKNRKKDKMGYYRTTEAYEKRMDMRGGRLAKALRKMKKIIIPHTIFDPYRGCFLNSWIATNLQTFTLENFNVRIKNV